MEYNKATILNMAKEMTRAEFLESKIVKDNCPSNFDIEDTIKDTDCCHDCVCKGCWFNSIQDIKFKDDTKKETISQSIEDVALNKPKETEEFDITKCDYITKQQLEKRGFKTGDIVFLNNDYKGIVYYKSVSYINKLGWNRIEDIKDKIIQFIPVELIYESASTAYDISYYINENFLNGHLGSLIIKIIKEFKSKIICKVNFVVNADNPKEFILENGQVKVGEMVEVCTGSTWQYARVKNIESKELTESEIGQYKLCRKLTE